jgi:hypothetical protein
MQCILLFIDIVAPISNFQVCNSFCSSFSWLHLLFDRHCCPSVITCTCGLWSCLLLGRVHNFNYVIIFFSFVAVCSLPPTEVLSELIQSPGPHCSSPSRLSPVSGALCGLLADWQKGGSFQFHIAFSGKKSVLR